MRGIFKPFYVKLKGPTSFPDGQSGRHGERFLVIGTVDYPGMGEAFLAVHLNGSNDIQRLNIDVTTFDGFRGECLLCEHRPEDREP